MEVPSRIIDAPNKGVESFASTTLPDILPMFWDNKLIEQKKIKKNTNTLINNIKQKILNVMLSLFFFSFGFSFCLSFFCLF